ncbi:MAG: sodium:solute symporter family protein [Nitritalea sp.]
MQLSLFDWLIIALFFILSLGIGLVTARKAGRSARDFFLSGRDMPWWLLGVSMVATTFSADTPNLVTDIVRKHGVSGNWVWWAFLLTGMLTVFVYARLWRRSEVATDLAFYELRYGGKAAAYLRAFRAVYLGIFFNAIIMATVCLAAIKIFGVMLGISPWQTLLFIGVVTVFYSALGGLKGVLLTDFFQFFLALAGAIGAAYYIVGMPEVGGLDGLFQHEAVAGKLSFFPDFNDPNLYIPLFLMPIAIQWWATWYPGAEPGGGGYIAQRMLAAKSEGHALGATLLFNVAHYALRPWPWMLIALASLIVFPSMEALQSAFPHIPADKLGDDLAYSAMLTFLPAGLLGLVLASLIAAVMSTLSTHLNWGASYFVYDVYQRFLRPGASEGQMVRAGRLTTLGLMLLAGGTALLLQDALGAFQLLLQVGAGTGLIFILRWFWWRINAYTEISGMVISFLVAIYLEQLNPRWQWIPIPPEQEYLKLVYGVLITTSGWLLVTWLTPAEPREVLQRFYSLTRPAPWGWKPVLSPELRKEVSGRNRQLGHQIGAMLTGTVCIYSLLLGTGFALYGNLLKVVLCLLLFGFFGILLRYFILQDRKSDMPA